MNMKFSLILFAMIALASCSDNTSTGSNTGGTSTYSGATYFPLTDNAVSIGHVTGVDTEFDINGTIVAANEIDRDCSASLGSIGARDGIIVHPVFAYDVDGSKTNGGNPVGYGGLSDSAVVAFDGSSPYIPEVPATILPKQLTVGQTWAAFPLTSNCQCQGKLVEHLASFTSKGGTAYKDVIHVSTTIFDSIFSIPNFSVYRYSLSGDIYFANGVGIVEADFRHYEFGGYSIYNMATTYYRHTGSGTVWRRF
jgi:hypothetical protein